MKFALLVVNDNRVDEVVGFFNQLSKIHKENKIMFEVYLLENGCSPDQQFKGLLREYAFPIVYSKSNELLTFASAYSLLFSRATMGRCDLVLVLKEVTKVDLEELVKVGRFFESNQDTVIVGLGSNKVGEMGVFEWYWMSKKVVKKSNDIQEIDWCEGVWAIRIDFVKKHRELSRSYYRGFETIEYFYKVRRGGGKIVAWKKPVVELGEVRVSPLRAYFDARNYYLFIHRNLFGWRRVWGLVVLTCFRMPVELIQVRNRDDWQKVVGGWIDGLKLFGY